ncbi:hypothetical protein CH305_18255 [Rhodococcus sp. 15-649-2-2]|uniref:hypothetical protein n=1 Tax=Rhodococcus sp. 15-649-2-2 TaxID=2023140 RepID=UPI000B9A8104|nr:hypothetical protein [Rhodococcus sp. 15-649-2-2]OZE77180.1 hypothetical protein CH305_18255 [Rhodococcus sp. 15-649-2-2]
MITVWYTAAYRDHSGSIVAVGIESRNKAVAEGELADWRRDAPDRDSFLAYRNVPEWQEVGE